MRHAVRLVIMAAVVLAAACSPTAPAAAYSVTDNFWIHCLYTGQTATIDPIVDPGSTTTGHFHDFYGNTTLTQDSTPDSLQAAGTGATTCSTATDTAAYWAPSLVLHPGETQTHGPAGYPCTVDAAGLTACHYSNIRAYYGLQGEPRSALTLTPPGEEAVGGDHAATGPQPTGNVSWSCGGSSPFEQYPYDCTSYINLGSDQDGVVLRVVFPRCWDGTGTQPADFAYPAGNVLGPKCVAPYAQVLPVVNVRFHTGIVTPCPGQACPAGSQVAPAFGFEQADGSELPWYDAHGDFMNGWQSGEGGLTDLELDCLKLAMACPVNPHTSPKSNMPT